MSGRGRRWPELAFHHPAVRGKPLQGGHDDGDTQSQPRGGFRRGEGPVGAGITSHQVAEGVRHRFNEGQGNAHGQRHPKGVAEPGGVFHRSDALGAGDVDAQRPVGRDQCVDVVDGASGFLGSLGDLGGGERAEQPEQVRDSLQPPHFPVGGQALELVFSVGDDTGVEQFTQFRPAQQLVQEGGVKGQCGRAALGERGVALVEEGRHVPEQHGAGERRGLGRGGLDDPQFAAVDLPRDVLQCGEIVDVLEALAHRLKDDRKGGEFPRHVQQLGRALPLLPQRAAL